MRKDGKTIMIWVTALLFVSVGFAIGAKLIDTQSIFFVFQNIMSISYVLMGLLIVISLRKHFNILSASMIIGNCILSLGQLYFLEYRFYHRLLIALFTLSIVYLIFYLLRFFVVQKKSLDCENIHFVNCIIPVVFIGGSLFIKTFSLLKLIETELGTFLMPIVFIALGVGVVGAIVGAIFIKDRQNKKGFFGKLMAIFSIVFLLIFVIPALSVEYANYVFDTSDGEKAECVVIEKQTRSGGTGGTNYYLILQIDGKKVDFSTEKVVYSQYQEGDTIWLYEYDGAFDYPYYEYRLDFIYRYKEE